VSDQVVRALAATDADRVRALARSVFDGTRHVRRTLELVELALTESDAECLGLVVAGVDGVVQGFVIYGPVDGAAGVMRVTALVGRSEDALDALLGRLRLLDAVREARMFFCELSDEPVHAPAFTALVTAGFTREDRIADYLADGIALDILVLRR
jgi:hypothetical protein